MYQKISSTSIEVEYEALKRRHEKLEGEYKAFKAGKYDLFGRAMVFCLRCDDYREVGECLIGRTGAPGEDDDCLQLLCPECQTMIGKTNPDINRM